MDWCPSYNLVIGLWAGRHVLVLKIYCMSTLAKRNGTPNIDNCILTWKI